MIDSPIRTISSLVVPFVILLSFYVQFHGDQSPGGGFQAGVLLASAFAVYIIVFDFKINEKLLHVLMPLGVLIYIATGVVPMFMGGNFLQHDVIADSDVTGWHLGIFFVEIGVFMTVASVMIMIYSVFASDD